jgi:hypothetical protein
MKNITYLTLFFNILLLSVAVRMPSLHTAWKTKSTSNSDPYVDNSNSNENTFKPYDKTHSSDVEQLYDAYNQLHTLAQVDIALHIHENYLTLFKIYFCRTSKNHLTLLQYASLDIKPVVKVLLSKH